MNAIGKQIMAGSIIICGWMGSAQAGENWVAAGETSAVRMDKQGIRISSDKPVTAGVLSEPFELSKGQNAVVVQSTIKDADVRAVTFSLHDAATGECVGYWQNPLAVEPSTDVTAVLPLSVSLSGPAPKLRLFAGTHNRASQASLRDLKWTPAGRTMRHEGSIYGIKIDDQVAAGQTFKATGRQLTAAVIKIRQLMAGKGGPDLQVSVYPWKGQIAASIEQPPIAQTVIPRHLIPGEARESGSGEVFVTYGAPPVNLAVPLQGPTQPGETYLLRISTTGPCSEGQGYISFGWVDDYPDGELFMNQNAPDWDLWLRIYETDR